VNGGANTNTDFKKIKNCQLAFWHESSKCFWRHKHQAERPRS